MGVGQNHGGGIFASQTCSPVHDTCSDFIRRDFLFIIFETLELGDGSCLNTNILGHLHALLDYLIVIEG